MFLGKNFNFYYDESEHSRKINHSTVVSDNYYDNFVTTIVGWRTEDENSILQRYLEFEEKYSYRKSNGELKSLTLKTKQLKNGLASLSCDNVAFILDFLDVFDDRIFLYFSVTSKVEYIVNQLFLNYKNSIFVDVDAMKYSIVKAIVMYQPLEIVSGMYENTGELVRLLKAFFHKRIAANRTNPSLKERENLAFSQILILLEDINEHMDINWNYQIAFDGFKKYLLEKGISNYALFIDKEGDDSDTLKAAKQIGFSPVTEVDSKEHVGVRIADMLAGIISKLLKSLHTELKYDSFEDGVNKKTLGGKWFELNDHQLYLYKRLMYIICHMNNAWYKAFSGNYSDDLITFISLLNYMSSYRTIDNVRAIDKKMHGEYFNAHVCERLAKHYDDMRSKLQVEPIGETDKVYYFNRRGGKVFFDSSKQPSLRLNEGSYTLDVLSVGFTKDGTPMVIVSEREGPICYKLPHELYAWAMDCVALANMGTNNFPSKVEFTKSNGYFYANFIV
ncbi:DUF3800 domain-containing protein [Paenibacillus sp. J22TS3]|uniref:DUF3800 domain-containing protein n=1 Tax=Paenibacillus sp. J22TS3 TaxID=2807192 RepID=UPI001B078B4F|nr:DUF3800 domain-containing protein [Paenibacillus sp. J22TS3]GIP22958.1 hypothetical protein J22TS3_32330 [Paenibacillus sp. J22TS3]